MTYQFPPQDNCQDFDCRHNIFWTDLNIKKSHSTSIFHEMRNCMCLLQGSLVLQEIGEMWGLSRERIRQLEAKALKRFAYIVITKKKDLEITEKELNYLKEFATKKLKGR